MAHSHDRTKLAQFGFSDPDKKDPDHELACAYLAQTDVAKKIFGLVYPRYPQTVEAAGKARKWLHDNLDAEVERIFEIDQDSGTFSSVFLEKFPSLPEGKHTFLVGASEHEHFRSQIEWHITKGAGQYKTSIGWVDVVISAEARINMVNATVEVYGGREGAYRQTPYSHRPRPGQPEEVYFRGSLGIEVKIAPTPISDTIRQLSFYGEYLKCDRWVIVTPRDLSDSEKSLIDKAKILHFKLGPDFEEFKSKKASRVSKPSKEI